MTDWTHTNVPHAGAGTHTVVVALEVDDLVLADVTRHDEIHGAVHRQLSGLLAGHVRAGSGPATAHGDLTEGCGAVGKPAPPVECSPPVAPARHDDVPACEDCGAPSLAGGRWCLRCFQTNTAGDQRGPKPPTRLNIRKAS